MEKPSLSLQQITPVLPDPDEFASEISASLQFIDELPNTSPFEISEDILNLWCIPEDQLMEIYAQLSKLEEHNLSPNILSSLMVFAHLYLRYYRVEDFADCENFAYMYCRFQTLLNFLKKNYNEPKPDIPDTNIKLFDLDNLDDIIDTVRESGAI